MDRQKIGRYVIFELLGKGGMGEVYRAVDTRLDRPVAIKLLRSDRTTADGVRRLKREAKLLGTLNHPNIATLYELGNDGGRPYLVIELVEGTTLAERLRAGAVSVDEAVRICGEIAGGLAAAHEKGIVHRDLKPSNVIVGSDGRVKVLDFGIARVFHEPRDLTTTSTESWITEPGAAIGTVPYMSPEQVRGQDIDKRSDVWSLGCVLFELLTGDHAFTGKTVPETFGEILHNNPDWGSLPPCLPSNVNLVLRLCLVKERRERLQDAHDVRVQLSPHAQWISGTTASASRPERGVQPARRRWLDVTAAAALLAIAGLAVWNTLPAGPAIEPATRLVLNLPSDTQLIVGRNQRAAISPDGRQVVYLQGVGPSALGYSRPIDQPTPRPIAGTEGADGVFFSPDGSWIGFFADGQIKKVPVAGGTPTALASAPNPRGASWGDGQIVFAAGPFTGISSVPEDGGVVTELTTLDASADVYSHRWPHLLPDGAGLLYVSKTREMDSYNEADVVAKSLVDDRSTTIATGTAPRFVAGRFVVFGRGKTLYAAEMDLSRLQLRDAPIPVLEDVGFSYSSGRGFFDVAENGTVIYLSFAGSTNQTLAWVDERGISTDLDARKLGYRSPRISPDGGRIALGVVNDDGTNDLWRLDLERQSLTRLTFGGLNTAPVWFNDSRRIVYAATQSEGSSLFNLYWMHADGRGSPVRILESLQPQVPAAVTSDGQTLYFVELSPTTQHDIWSIPINANATFGSAEAVLASEFAETHPRPSPTADWLAYVSDESGRREVYARFLGTPTRREQVSTTGGTEPVWSPDGSSLFYRFGTRVMSVSILGTGLDLDFSAPRELFARPAFSTQTLSWHYDYVGDRGFVMIRNDAAAQLEVILHWFSSLRQRFRAS